MSANVLSGMEKKSMKRLCCVLDMSLVEKVHVLVILEALFSVSPMMEDGNWLG